MQADPFAHLLSRLPEVNGNHPARQQHLEHLLSWRLCPGQQEAHTLQHASAACTLQTPAGTAGLELQASTHAGLSECELACIV